MNFWLRPWPPVFSRAAITLGIGPHSGYMDLQTCLQFLPTVAVLSVAEMSMCRVCVVLADVDAAGRPRLGSRWCRRRRRRDDDGRCRRRSTGRLLLQSSSRRRRHRRPAPRITDLPSTATAAAAATAADAVGGQEFAAAAGSSAGVRADWVWSAAVSTSCRLATVDCQRRFTAGRHTGAHTQPTLSLT